MWRAWRGCVLEHLMTLVHRADQILIRLDRIETALRALIQQEAGMATDLTTLKDGIAAIKGTEASTRELVTQVSNLVAAQTAKIQQLIDAGTIDPAELQAAVDDLNATTTSLTQDRDALASAVASNPVP